MSDDEMMDAILRSRVSMTDPSVATYVMARGISKAIKRMLRK
ncbi:hypothetical protein [Bifidobacterium avesanii]|nr:hypothetical protein [Bifidobacterium avesanii]KAB8292791.1 hypothetical protein DSM100685_0802 [Bifidobacterium avesanii]